MDFKESLKGIIKKFHEEEIDFALIGAFALLQLGIERATRDIDFLISDDDTEKVEKIMHSLTYETVQMKKFFSQYHSPLKVFGNVDFIHATGATGHRILKDARSKTVFGLELKTALPEDLIGLKVLAYANDPQREERDKSDIHKINEAYRNGKIILDLKKIERYYKNFEKMDDYRQLWGESHQGGENG